MKVPVVHLGGEKCVTGSCHFMQLQGVNILVDCGMTQGEDRGVDPSQWPVRASELDFIFLTHAHVDHIGMLPRLIADGFGGEIICTHPTKALIVPMLNDAMRFEHLSDDAREDVTRRIDDLSWGFECGPTFDLKRGISFKLGRAGHILGSCFVRLESARDGFSILFSGDLGNRDTPLLPDPETADPADFLILESTYGNRLHGDRTQRVRQLAGVLTHCLADGGKVFIPAFALGRTQEILYELDRIFSDDTYREMYPQLRGEGQPPVFVDSPLGLDITQIYSGLHAYWDEEATSLLMSGDDPLDFERLFAVPRHYQHEQLLEVDGPLIIIAGSGMCTGGRIVDHLVHGIEEPRNDILFVGYMTKGTPGRCIQAQAESHGTVLLDGVERQVRAGVHELSGYSAHADQKGLLDWVAAIGGRPKMIRLVHGEDDARSALAAALEQRGYVVG